MYTVAAEKGRGEPPLRPVIEVARAQADAVAIETHLVPGHVVEAIVRLINERRFDLLVAGFTGYSQLYEHIIGGTTDRLVRLAPCFVLAVR